MPDVPPRSRYRVTQSPETSVEFTSGPLGLMGYVTVECRRSGKDGLKVIARYRVVDATIELESYAVFGLWPQRGGLTSERRKWINFDDLITPIAERAWAEAAASTHNDVPLKLARVQAGRRPNTDGYYARSAELYCEAIASGFDPHPYIAEKRSVSKATAERHISIARQRHLLTSPDDWTKSELSAIGRAALDEWDGQA